MSEDLKANVSGMFQTKGLNHHEYNLGLLLNEFTVVCVGDVVPFLVNNFVFPETERIIFSLCPQT